MATERYDIADLLSLMERLRDPRHGCPWDIKQDFRSITSSTIEEAYEVVDAIEHNDFEHLREELGDLLFQVIFYCQLAQEDQLFDFAEVIDALTAKLVRRHPHVFPDGTLASFSELNQRKGDEQVKLQWETVKAEERKQRGNIGLLADVPVGLPALSRAVKLQKRAAQVGFDWREAAPVVAKIREELHELEQAMAATDEPAIGEELGDVLFSVVNLARHLRHDPEKSLRLANQKFARRFESLERQLSQRGLRFEDVDEHELDAMWRQAKAELASPQ